MNESLRKLFSKKDIEKLNDDVHYEYRIMVSVGENTFETRSDHGSHAKRLGASRVAWGAHKEKLEERNQKNAGERTYVISPVDTTNKESEGYTWCTGIVAVGKTKEGTNISLLTHQAPYYIAKEPYRTKFIQDVTTELLELRSKSLPGTIDVIIVGGNVQQKEDIFGREMMDKKEHNDYLKDVEMLTRIVRDNLQIEPRVFGPNFYGLTDIVLDTANRRLYMQRGKTFRSDFDKPASEVLAKKKRK